MRKQRDIWNGPKKAHPEEIGLMSEDRRFGAVAG